MLPRTFASIDGLSEDFLATSRLSNSVLRQCTFLGWINSAAASSSRFLSLIRVVLVSLVIYFSPTFLLLLILCFSEVFLRSQMRISSCLLLRQFVFSLLLVFIVYVCYSSLIYITSSHCVLLVFRFRLLIFWFWFWAIAGRVFLLCQLHMFNGRKPNYCL